MPKITISSITVDANYDIYSELDYGVGIVARAVVRYADRYGITRLEALTSGGIYDIDGHDSEGIESWKTEEFADLKQHLEVFGVDISDFDAHADKAYVIHHDA